MKKRLAFATLCLFAFIGFIAAINFGKQYIATSAHASASVAPQIIGEGKTSGVRSFLYFELPHGWIIMPGSGSTFVPKPQ